MLSLMCDVQMTMVCFHDKQSVVATASTCNVVLMRYNELFEGIEVVNESQEVIGTSQAAGRKV